MVKVWIIIGVMMGIKQLPHTPKQWKTWTIAIYINADNDLEPCAIGDINEMERGIDTSKYNVLVLMDRHPDYDYSNGNWTTTRLYYITPDPIIDTNIRSYLIADFGELNMGDPYTLIDFAEWVIDYFPSTYFALIIWNHGDGWYKGERINPLFKGIGPDETNNDILGVANGEYALAMSSIRNYLGYPIDILANDACLMGMHEVAYEVFDYVDYFVGSEHTEPGGGYPYKSIFQYLNSNPYATPSQLASQIVSLYIASYQPGGYQYCGQSVTQSAIYLGFNFLKLNQSINSFAYALMTVGGRWNSEVQFARALTQEYAISHHIDLYDFADMIKSYTNLPQYVKNWADSVMKYVNYSVIAEGHYSDPNDDNVDFSHGIAIYYPADISSINYEYANLDFAQDYPNWWEFLKGTDVRERITFPKFELKVFPNVVLNSFILEYNLSSPTNIELALQDITGRLIKRIENGYQKPGKYTIKVNLSEIPSGVYFLNIKGDNFSSVRKIIKR